MSKIIYIREIDSSHLLRVGVGHSEECVGYTVSQRVYAELGRPEVGRILTDGELEAIRYSDETCRAERKALSLLSYTDNNSRTLVQKLVRAGFKREIAEETAKDMVALGYIDERRQLERLIAAEADKLRGPGRIIPKLAAKGYATSDIKEVMHELCDRGEVDFSALAKQLLDKKLPEGAVPEERKKLLYKHGFKIC